MFKRDLFEITDEDPAGPAEAWSAAGHGPAEVAFESPDSGAGDKPHKPAPPIAASPRRWADWRGTAALVVGFAGLLLSLVAMTGRPVASRSADNAAAPRSAATDRKATAESPRKTRSSRVGARASRPSRVAVDGLRMGERGRRRKRSSTSGSEPAQHAPFAPDAEYAPVPHAAPRTADDPRAGEFDFEVRDR